MQPAGHVFLFGSLGSRRNRREISEVIIFAAIGDGFQVFGVPSVGDADTEDLPLFCHIHSLLFFHNGIVGKLLPGVPAALFHQTDDPLCIGIGLRDLIQGLLYKFFSVHTSIPPFCVVFAKAQRICSFTNWRIL